MGMGWLIMRTEQGGGYLAVPSIEPGGHSWTKNPKYMRVFPSKESAESDLCVENEVVVPVESLFHGKDAAGSGSESSWTPRRVWKAGFNGGNAFGIHSWSRYRELREEGYGTDEAVRYLFEMELARGGALRELLDEATGMGREDSFVQGFLEGMSHVYRETEPGSSFPLPLAPLNPEEGDSGIRREENPVFEEFDPDDFLEDLGL